MASTLHPLTRKLMLPFTNSSKTASYFSKITKNKKWKAEREKALRLFFPNSLDSDFATGMLIYG